MKQTGFGELGRVLEGEYEVAHNRIVANWLNIGAGLIIIGIVGAAIWKIDQARRQKTVIKERGRRIMESIKQEVDGTYAAANWAGN
jgi:hypothetical protein